MKKLNEEVRALFETDEIKSALESIKAADGDSGTFEVVITTEHLDRYQEVIKLDAWELEHYRNNPVVLWGHDHNRLIGVATSVEIVDGKMIAKGKFAPTEEGQEKRRLYDLGFLKATSVGFIEKEREGNLITKAELLEFSFVSVPANPYALSLAMEKELNINELVTKGFMDISTTVPKEKVEEKGAIQEQQETVEAREQKWKNFAEVDNLVCAFWQVYFDTNTPVDAFKELCTETADLMKKIAGGEKATSVGGVEVKDAGMQLVRDNIEKLKSTDIVSVALEALTRGEEPERNEEDEEPAGETEEEKGFREFSDTRRTLQVIATDLGAVLADMRKEREAQK